MCFHSNHCFPHRLLSRPRPCSVSTVCSLSITCDLLLSILSPLDHFADLANLAVIDRWTLRLRASITRCQWSSTGMKTVRCDSDSGELSNYLYIFIWTLCDVFMVVIIHVHMIFTGLHACLPIFHQSSCRLVASSRALIRTLIFLHSYFLGLPSNFLYHVCLTRLSENYCVIVYMFMRSCCAPPSPQLMPWYLENSAVCASTIHMGLLCCPLVLFFAHRAPIAKEDVIKEWCTT